VGEEPDVMVGNIGGGSNYGGFCLPYVAERITGKNDVEFVACESKAVPQHHQRESTRMISVTQRG
jgi:Predicted alternative tryptophan synthase beta-subunit (paralog of TrpB)